MTEDMEMPTRCDCGNWFDLNDGCANHNRTITICDDCAEQNDIRKGKEGDIEQRKREIEDLEDQIEDIKNLILADEEDLKELPDYK